MPSFGAYVNDVRPRSKKALREAAAADPRSVVLDNTSAFPGDGPSFVNLATAADGRYTVVGPDPYTRRTWYGTVTVKGGNVKVS
jgi:hypothetical protein